MTRTLHDQLPITGPDGERVTYGMARAKALSVAGDRRATPNERALAKLVLAFLDDLGLWP